MFEGVKGHCAALPMALPLRMPDLMDDEIWGYVGGFIEPDSFSAVSGVSTPVIFGVTHHYIDLSNSALFLAVSVYKHRLTHHEEGGKEDSHVPFTLRADTTSPDRSRSSKLMLRRCLSMLPGIACLSILDMVILSFYGA